MTVANHLKEIRKSRGLHQKDLANATGFSSKTIGRVEREECLCSLIISVTQISDLSF